jgi:hypothetical protein
MRRKFIAGLFLALAGMGACLGQTTKSVIHGFVFDSSGAVVPNVQLVLKNEGTGAAQSAVSASDGAFVFPGLLPGSYSLSATMQGFKAFRRQAFQLQVNQQLRVDAVLEPGQLSETVTVTDSPVQVDTRTATLKEIVSRTAIIELPLNGRNVLSLLTLQAGVVASGGTFVQAYSQAGAGYNVSGGRGNSVNFLLNGGTNIDTYTNVANLTPNPDAVEEFSLQNVSYGAEFARPGGVVNLISRSGTNEVHGAAYNFLRNGALNARNFFAARRDMLIRNQFGFSLGGPVYLPKLFDGRNRTFFFANYEGLRTNGNSGVGNVVTPTAAQRAGDLSSVATPVLDPLTRQPFPGNQIPAARLDPAMQNFLKAMIPLPEADGRFRFVSSISRAPSDQYTLRGDQNIGSSDRLYVSYFNVEGDSSSPGTVGNMFDMGGGTQYSTRHLAANHTHLFSPSVVNTFQFSWNHRSKGFFSGLPFAWADFGVNFKPISDSPHGGFYSAIFNAVPPLVGKVSGDTFHWSNALSWVRGRHEFKFGGDAFYDKLHFDEKWVSGGRFIFRADFTNHGLGDMMLGLPTQFRVVNPNLSDSTRPAFAFYAQDTFKASRRFSVNYGVRWEPFLNWKETRGQTLWWAPGQQSRKYPNLPPNLLAVGDPGVPVRGQNNDIGRLAPRLGLAFDPRGNGRWSIRAGYGFFLDTAWVPAETGLITSGPPFNFATLIVNPPSFRDPFQGRVNPYPAPIPAPPDMPQPRPLGGIGLYSPDLGNPYIQQWNLSIERQLPSRILARASYVGSKGTYLLRSTAFNPAVYIPGNAPDGTPLSSVANTQARRVYQDFTSLDVGLTDGNSIYHGLQTTLERPMHRNLLFKVNYTLSKTLDDSKQSIGPASADNLRSPFNRSLDKGRADFDRRHVLVASFVGQSWNPKQANPLLRGLLGGWVMTGIVTAQTGAPFTPRSGQDRSLSAVGQDTPDIVGDPHAPSGAAERRLGWFNTRAFAPNALGTPGNAGRNILSAPGLFNIDFGAYKNFPIPLREGFHIQFRSEFFNFLNHTNFGSPNATLTSPDFGKIFSAAGPRILQFALRVNF